ncbi:hypothetical protein LEP1GSC082_4588 [Leptospira kirschneri str. H2]|nr:hypothetical protein LEP1GSC082_4588 [Leptospira kirschneri str. H2]
MSATALEVTLTTGIPIFGIYKTFSISNPNLGYATTEALLILTLSNGEEKSINFLNIADIKKQNRD